MIRFFIRLFAGIAIGFFFIWWVLQNVQIDEVKILISQVSFLFIFLAMSCYAMAIILRIYRWKLLLLPFVPLNFWQVGSALITGYAMNIILPARLGELFRVNICKTWYSVPRSAVLASVVWERVSDGVIVVSCLFIGAIFLGSTYVKPEVQGLMLSGVFIFGSAILGLFFLRKVPLNHLLKRWPSLFARASVFQKGVRDLSLPALAQMMGLGILVWFFEGISLWSIVGAAGASLSLVNTCLLVGIVSLCTLLPSPPGFLGTMQFAFAIALLTAGHTASVGILAATLTQLFLLGALASFGILIYSWISLKNRKFYFRKL